MAEGGGLEKKQCEYVVAQRSRRCRMVASEGSVFCGEHLIHDQVITTYSIGIFYVSVLVLKAL